VTDCTESNVATHLFRITQESVRNAVRHGGAKGVKIALSTSLEGLLILTVQVDGSGLPPPAERGKGLGLRIMAHRAAMIHAAFKIEAPATGGTIVECRLPYDATHSDA
jgi:signal transduction histidine kinase